MNKKVVKNHNKRLFKKASTLIILILCSIGLLLIEEFAFAGITFLFGIFQLFILMKEITTYEEYKESIEELNYEREDDDEEY